MANIDIGYLPLLWLQPWHAQVKIVNGNQLGINVINLPGVGGDQVGVTVTKNMVCQITPTICV